MTSPPPRRKSEVYHLERMIDRAAGLERIQMFPGGRAQRNCVS